MKLKSHIWQGIILSPIAYYLTDFKKTIVFIVSFIFIDIDHYIHYIYRCKNFSIKKMFLYYDEMWRNREDVFGISIFHTIEVFLLLFLLGFWRLEFWIIGFGFLTHLLFDIFYLFKHNVLFTRAFSCIEYFLRKKNYSKEKIY